MQFFWVNLGTTHKEARDGKFLWAPLSSRSKTGKKQTRRHWDNVGKVKAGDLIFCYHDNYLRAIAKAERDAYPAERPPISVPKLLDYRLATGRILPRYEP